MRKEATFEGFKISRQFLSSIITHSDASGMVNVDDAFGVRACGMDGRMEDETGNVDSKVRCSRVDHIAL